MAENLRVIFTEKAESVFSDILKNNGFTESDEEFFDELNKDKESKSTIIRDAAVTLVQKLIPDQKTGELLQKHLGVSQEIVNKIVIDIKIKLLPLLLMYPDEKFDDPNFAEEISKEVFGAQDSTLEINSETKELIERIKTANISEQKKATTMPPVPNIKKITISDVEKNAEGMIKRGENITTQEKDKFAKKPEGIKSPQPPQTKPDSYREPIE